MNRKYYKRINNLDISLEKTNHKCVMINQWAKDNSHNGELQVLNMMKMKTTGIYELMEILILM